MRHCVLAPVALLAVAAAGCGSPAATHGAAPPTASASTTLAPPNRTAAPTPTPSVTATPFVTAADEAGAYAFVKAYFSSLDHAFRTGDVQALVPLRSATCSCVRFEQTIRDVYDVGGHISGAKLTILGWAFGSHGPGFARTAVYFHASQVRNVIKGKPDHVDAAFNGYYAVDLRRTGNSWVVNDVRLKIAS